MKFASLRTIYSGLTILWLSGGLWIWKSSTGYLRFYGGDVLVVGFLFWMALAIWPATNRRRLAIGIMAIALVAELAPLINLDRFRATIGQDMSTLILGTNFDWLDLGAYLLGVLLCFVGDNYIRKLCREE